MAARKVYTPRKGANKTNASAKASFMADTLDGTIEPYDVEFQYDSKGRLFVIRYLDRNDVEP